MINIKTIFLKMKHIIVTGSEGFIGKELIKVLKSDNNIVYEIDRKIGIEVNGIESIINRHHIDIVYHLAAQTSVFNKDTEQIVKDNILAFVKVANICHKHNIKLVYASSSVANPLNTTSLYGLSKRFDEEYARLYCPNATGVRLHNVYSERFPRKGTLMWHINNNDVITLYNNGQNKRYFTEVKYAVKGLIYASGLNENIVNCYNPKLMTTKQFTDIHNKQNKEVILLDEIRELDKEMQYIDDKYLNIYDK